MNAWRLQGGQQLEVAEGTSAILFRVILLFIPGPFNSFLACKFLFKKKGDDEFG